MKARMLNVASAALILVSLLTAFSSSSAQVPVPPATSESEQSIASEPPPGETSETIDIPPEAQSLPPGFVPDVGAERDPKLESSLNQLLEVRRREGLAEAQAFATTRRMTLDDSRVQVVVEATGETVGDLREAVETLGGVYQTHYKTLLQALVPIESLESLAERPDVLLVREPRRPTPTAPVQIGGETSEGVAASNASTWQAAGYDGTGARVAVIDSGFAGYAGLRGTDLPASVNTYDWTGKGMGGDEHGTACAEVIYDMAPGAAMDLHKVSTKVEVGNAVDQAIADGVDIISMSLAWRLDGPGDGTGNLANMVDDARSSGILFVTAAGNNAGHSWSGKFDSHPSLPDSHQWPHGGNVNCFGPETPDLNCRVIPAGFPIVVTLHWDDWSVGNQDYDLVLFYWDGDSWELYAASDNRQAEGYPKPEEEISVYAPADAAYAVAVWRYSASRDVCLRVNAWHNMPDGLDERVPERSVMFPGDSPDAFTVGAVDAASPYPLEPYSSRGPTFGPGGACSGGSIKPDIAAYANVSTMSYGTGEFSGTSAATPHVAGAAALVKDAYPDDSVTELQSYLESSAVDMGNSGKDNLYGSGRLQLGDPPTGNSPPHLPSEPSPDDGATAVSTNADLSWTGGDPDPGDTVTYDVYLEADDSTPGVLVCEDVDEMSCDPGMLDPDTHYYWYVEAQDSHDATATSDTWDFTTRGEPDCSILFDASHDTEGFDTIDENYADFADEVRAMGYGMDELQTGPLTPAALSGYCGLVLADPETAFTEDEVEAVHDFVEAGGGLFVLGEGGDKPENNNCNPILEPFGMRLDQDFIYDETDNHVGISFHPLIHEFADHPVTAGLTELWYAVGASIDVEAPAQKLGWGDGDSYTWGGHTLESSWATSTPVIDGHISAGEWSEATRVDLRASAEASTVMMYLKNDGQKLYLAFDDPNDTTFSPGNYDQTLIHFDDEPTGARDGAWTYDACPSGEGNFWVGAFDPDPSTAFRGIASGPELCDPVEPAAGVNGETSAASGHVQHEVAIDLSTSELRGSPGDEIGMDFLLYDYDTESWNGFWTWDAVPDDPSTYGDVRLAAANEVGRSVAIAASRYGSGRVVVLGDSGVVRSYDGDENGTPDIYQYDAERFAENVVEWICQCGEAPNTPPNAPSDPSPADGATDVSNDADLSWTGGDADPGDTVTYDVYFEAGDSTPDELACDDATEPFCDPGTLSEDTEYYWYVVASDDKGGITTGDTWHFTTGPRANEPPHEPSNPTPADDATDQDLDVDLSWIGGDPDAGDDVTYDVYFRAGGSLVDTHSLQEDDEVSLFSPTRRDIRPGLLWGGTKGEPEMRYHQPVGSNAREQGSRGRVEPADELICDDVPEPACDPGTLDAGRHYYWHVVATDSHGASTEGEIWHFTTEAEAGGPVYLPLVMRRYPPLPDVPVLNAISDPDGDGSYTVSWEEADLAQEYVLEEDDNGRFSSPTERYRGTGLSWSASGKAPGTYYYRVKATNEWGESGWSNVESVTVAMPEPDPCPPDTIEYSGTTDQDRPVRICVDPDFSAVKRVMINYSISCSTPNYGASMVWDVSPSDGWPIEDRAFDGEARFMFDLDGTFTSGFEAVSGTWQGIEARCQDSCWEVCRGPIGEWSGTRQP